MTPSELFAPPAARTIPPWLTWGGVAVACVVGAITMSNFIDTLHLSMARGEALRVTQRLAGLTSAKADRNETLTQLYLPRVKP